MKTANRLLYLDWVRGLAAVTMLQGHVFHSFLKTDLRNSGPYSFSQFLGGMPPAIFLFLTGVTFAFLMDSQEREGATGGARWVAALRRSGYLFLMAFLFRLQLWVFALYFSPGSSPWTDLFRVDILNSMGFALGILAVLALFNRTDRIRVSAVVGLWIAALAPLVSQLNLAGWPSFVKDYLVPSNQFFGFFPWASFVAFGLTVGTLLRSMKPQQFNQTMQWIAIAGIFLALGANSIPMSIYGGSIDFWLNSPVLVLIKLGVILVLVTFAYIWTLQPAAQSWSWVRTLGTNSLLVYWVHIELVYGHWLGFWKENLSVLQTGFLAAGVVALMVLLCVIRAHFGTLRAYLMTWRRPLAPEPSEP